MRQRRSDSVFAITNRALHVMIRKRTNDRSTNRHQRSSLWRNWTDRRALKRIQASLVVRGFSSDSAAPREPIFARIAEPDLFVWNTLTRGAAQSLM
ncbi:hypothetical protein NL676_029339 [Syzygium grande]|nr:hypothetical protein NL676_029339 [Syzygium grande]